MTGHVCRTCEKGPSYDQPLVRCGKCASSYHNCCHRPAPTPEVQQGIWVCRRCVRFSEENSRYGQHSSTSSFASTAIPSHPRFFRSGPIGGSCPPQTNNMGNETPEPCFGAQCHHPGCSSTIKINQNYCTKHRDQGTEQDMRPSFAVGPGRLERHNSAGSSQRSVLRSESQPESRRLSPEKDVEQGKPESSLPANSRLAPEFRERAKWTARKETKPSLFKRIGATPQSLANSPPRVSPRKSQPSPARSGGQASNETPRSRPPSPSPNKPTRPSRSAAGFTTTAQFHRQNGTSSRKPSTSDPQPPRSAPRKDDGSQNKTVTSGDAESSTPQCNGSATNHAPPSSHRNENVLQPAPSSNNSAQPKANRASTTSQSIPTVQKDSDNYYSLEAVRALQARCRGWQGKDGTLAARSSIENSHREPAVDAARLRTNGLFPKAVDDSSKPTKPKDTPPEALNASKKRRRSPDVEAAPASTTAAATTQPPRPTLRSPAKIQAGVRGIQGSSTGRPQQVASTACHNPPQKRTTNGTVRQKKPTMEQLRSRLEESFDQAELDATLYAQHGASLPPSGVNVPTREAKAQDVTQPSVGEDNRAYLNLDPRIHWPRAWDEEWYERKIQEIRARGGRKDYFGEPARRLRELRKARKQEPADSTSPHLDDGYDADDEHTGRRSGPKPIATIATAVDGPNSRSSEPQPWSHRRPDNFGDVPEAELPAIVRSNADWIKVCAWMRTTREKTHERDREAARLVDAGKSISHLLGLSGW